MDQVKNFHLEKTWRGFFYNVLGVTLPFILSLIPILILKKYENIFSFLDHGQFLIFSAGLFTSSVFLFSENHKSIKSKSDKILSNISLWSLIICSSFYAIIYCLNILEINIKIDLLFIRFASLILYFIAVYSIYRSVYIDFLKTYPKVDVKKESKKGVDNILGQL